MKTKIRRGKTIFYDGKYFTDIKLRVHYLSAGNSRGIDYSYSLDVERFFLIYNKIEEFLEIQLIEEVFDDETLFLFENYYWGRFKPVKTKYRIYSKKTIDLINEKFSVIDGETGDFITDLVFDRCDGRITSDYSEWGLDNDLLFTGDDLVQFPYDPDSDKSKELFKRVKMMMRQQKINNLIEKAKR